MVAAGEVSKDEAVAGGVVIVLGWAMMCLWALRSGGWVYCSSFFVKYFDCKKHPGSIRSDMR
jgi:hypothetical protein